MGNPKADVAKILEHVARARAELRAAEKILDTDVDVAELLGSRPIGDLWEAIRRLGWLEGAAKLRVEGKAK